MLYSMPQKQTPRMSIKIGTTCRPIEQVYNFNFLGIVLNSNLKWENHINNVSNKCTRVIGILNKLKKVLPTRIKVLLYNTLILPHLTYGITVGALTVQELKHCKKIHVTRIHHEFARRLVRNSIPYTINNLPKQVVSKIRTHSLTGFTAYTKHFLIQSYQENGTLLNCYVCSKYCSLVCFCLE